MAKKEESRKFRPVVKLQVCTDEPVFGPGLIKLLEHLEESGSMKEACQKMEMSYSKGWKIINRAERELGTPLLIRHQGGRSGGKCEITAEGKTLMEKYRAMEAEVKMCARASFERWFGELVT